MPQVWTKEAITQIYQSPFMDLLFRAQTVHRANFNPNELEICALLSIKTGACPEDCSYCPQSGHYNTGLKRERLVPLETVIERAAAAKAAGATRFCMGAAWRNPPKAQLPKVAEMIKAVNDLGLESCVTLGMLDQDDVNVLKAAGLDYYNHNIDTSPEHYDKITTTRTFQDRLDTLDRVRDAGINVCCGGIMGMGESREDRINFLYAIACMPEIPKSVPINRLLTVKGTPLENQPVIDNTEFIRTIATARILFPQSRIRLSAGRESMSDEMQILCYFAGANSIWNGDVLLTLKNSSANADAILMQKLGLTAKTEDQAVAC